MGVLNTRSPVRGNALRRWMLGVGLATVALVVSVAFVTCDRKFDGPYLPDSPEYPGSAWATDYNGDGVADSVEKYAPDCADNAADCLKEAQGRAKDIALGKLIIPDTIGIITPVDSHKIVIVVPKQILVDSLSAPDMILLPGALEAPPVQVLPTNAANRAIELSSGNAEVAEVREGAVFGAEAGITTMSAHSLDGSDKLVRFRVTVAPKPVKLKPKSLRLPEGNEAVTPVLVFTPPDAEYNGYMLSGGNPAVAAVGGDGRTIIPVGPGQTSLRASVLGYPGVSGTLHVTVDPAVISVRGVHAEDMDFVIDDITAPSRADPVIAWDPPDATDKNYALTSDNPLVARIVGGSVVTVFPGETRVTLTSYDGGLRATFSVRVSMSQTGCLPILGACPDAENGNGKDKQKG